jgi:glycosyltransferase involved in cell wall biosynthesis
MLKNILFVHSTSSFGGASKSLSELGKILSKSASLSVITPNGNVVGFFKGSGMTVYTGNISQFNHTEYGCYRGFRWIVLLRELIFLPISFYKINKLIQSNHYDLIHLNEVTLLPWAWYFKKRNLPVVVHVRSVYKPFTNSKRDRFFLNLFRNYIGHIIAIDETVKESLPKGLPVTVIHNGLKFSQGYPKPHVFQLSSESELNVCIVGSLLRLKGLYEFIKASKILINKELNIKFHIAGTNPRKKDFVTSLYKRFGLYDDVYGDLKAFVAENSLENKVMFHGLVKDIAGFYENMDVVCFPSYYNAPGRPVFEAAYYGIPSIVAVDRPTKDTIIHNETGLVIEKPCAQLLAEQIEKLYLDRKLLTKLGKGARQLAEEHYSLERNARKVFDIYQTILSNKGS